MKIRLSWASLAFFIALIITLILNRDKIKTHIDKY